MGRRSLKHTPVPGVWIRHRRYGTRTFRRQQPTIPTGSSPNRPEGRMDRHRHYLKMAMIFVVLFPIGCKDAAIDSRHSPPRPKADFDAIASKVIRNHAEKLARNRNALVWKSMKRVPDQWVAG